MGKVNRIPNILLIGAGYHAKDIHLPWFGAAQRSNLVRLAAIVDLDHAIPGIVKNLPPHGLASTRCVGVPEFSGENLPNYVASVLNALVAECPIEGVIITVPPELHKAYTLWALDQGFDILLDKPITTRDHAANRIDQALGIYQDYRDILKMYQNSKKRRDLALSIHTPRRFHPAFVKVFELLSEIRDKANWPVTSVYSMHSDGQWRLPAELIDLDNHGYNRGTGVISHSGYHLIDIACQFLTHGTARDKMPDFMDIYASFVRVRGVLRQMKAEHYSAILPEYMAVAKYDDDQLYDVTEDFGEIDAFVSIDLVKDRDVIGHITIEDLHNSFSQRYRPVPNMENLYKGMGRLNHEYHSIQQGPLQNIQMHAYQSKSPQTGSDLGDFEVGGNNHRDIYVFRNANILGGERLQRFGISSLMPLDLGESASRKSENAVLDEFSSYLRGELSTSDLLSNIDTHWLPVAVLSGVYAAYVNKVVGNLPMARVDMSSREVVPVPGPFR